VLTSFGESHGKCVGAVLDGCPAGLEIEEKDIQKMLNYRKPGQSLVSTQRKKIFKKCLTIGDLDSHLFLHKERKKIK
jgi:chorismate synthase